MANMFDENGNYNKTEWKPGDRITAGKLNKIEESLEAINNNDIERHKEADERLDALEEQNEAVEERFDELEDLVADNKTEVDTAIYEVHSKMDRLKQEMNDGIDTVEAIAHTVDDKIADADASMKAQVAEAEDIVDQGKADMEAMVAEVEADLEGLHAKDEELSAQLTHIENKIFINISDFGAIGDGINDDTEAIQNALNTKQDIKFDENKIYRITEDLIFSSNTFIDFNGSTIKVDRQFKSVKYPINLKHKEHIYLFNGVIDANVSKQYINNCHVIFGMYAKNCVVDGMTIIDFGGDDSMTSVDGYTGTAVGFTLDSSNLEGNCYGNIVKNCIIDSSNGSFGIRFASPWLTETDYYCKNNHAYNNMIKNIGKSGIEIAGHTTSYCSAVGNTIERTHLEGIDIDKNASDCLVENNTIKECLVPNNSVESYTDSYGGIGCLNVDSENNNLKKPGRFNRIINNKILSSVGSGIYLNGGSDCIIEGNYILNCKKGIELHGYSEWTNPSGNNNLIKNNIIENCTNGVLNNFSTDISIEKNVILNNDKYSLYFGKCKNTIINGNKIYPNPQNNYCVYFNSGFEDVIIKNNYFSLEKCGSDVKLTNLIWVLSAQKGNFYLLNNEFNGNQKISNVINIYNCKLNNVKIINNNLYNNDLINGVNRYTFATNSSCNNLSINNNVGRVGVLGTYENKLENNNIDF